LARAAPRASRNTSSPESRDTSGEFAPPPLMAAKRSGISAEISPHHQRQNASSFWRREGAVRDVA
jgi:hypothetical protein